MFCVRTVYVTVYQQMIRRSEQSALNSQKDTFLAEHQVKSQRLENL